MKFSLTIDSGNAAFDREDHGVGTVEDILKFVAEMVGRGQIGGAIYDPNGNSVGDWELDTEIDDAP